MTCSSSEASPQTDDSIPQNPVVGGLPTAHASVNRTNLYVTHFLVREVGRSGDHPTTGSGDHPTTGVCVRKSRRIRKKRKEYHDLFV